MGIACFSSIVNIELHSMGGIVECGVSVDTKASPRRAAIEKAQEELRQEYDVREERRRELEFLEKGGNPLDFKLGHVASLSVQSTSLTDQIAEQNVISEAKGSFAVATSPHGDSVESSGKPGSSLGCEPNTADNLLLLDGDNSNIGGEKNVKRGCKRTNPVQPEQTLQIDGHHNPKEADDSGIFRLGTKSQAYARRNRSKSSRDAANIACVRSPAAPPSGADPKDAKGAVQELQTDDLVVSSISHSKPASPNSNVVSKAAASDDHVAMEVDGVQTDHEGNIGTKSGTAEGENEGKAPEALPDAGNNNQQFPRGGDMVTADASFEAPDVDAKEAVSAGTHSTPSPCNEKLREDMCIAEKVDDCRSDKSVVNVHGEDLNDKTAASDNAVEAASVNTNEVDPSVANMTKSVDGHTDGNENFVSTKADCRSDEDPNDNRPSDNNVKEIGQLESDSRSNVGEDNCNSTQLDLCNAVHPKDEKEVCDSMTDAKRYTGQLTFPDPVKKDDCMGDSSSMHNSASIARVSAYPRRDVPDAVLSVRNSMPNPEVEIQNSGGNQSKMAKKEYEDSVLKKARLIEVNLKRAGELSPCNLFLEKRPKCHWDFVLQEMAWLANDFMQERLWKTTAAAQVCHWIASSARAKFEQASIQRKQKTVARTLAKATMNFWHSVEALRTSGDAPNVMKECNLDMLKQKFAGLEAEKQQGNGEENSGRVCRLSIQDYALRFLTYSRNASECPVLAEAPPTPDRLNDVGILELSDQLSEESLFYTVAPGAMLAYRESMESQCVYHKKMGHNVHKEECETSMCDSVADAPRENAYEEDEGETCTYMLPGTYDGGLSSSLGHKKKHQMQQKMNGTRLYEVATDMSYEPCLESKSGNQPLSNGKRTSSFLAIPTKRIRTAARQRVVSPFNAGVTGTPQVTSKTDVSSGDTNSCQDDQSSLQGGSLPRKNMDIESTVDYDRQLPYDGNEVSAKSKKKKKPKHLGYKNSLSVTDSCALIVPGKGSAYDQRSQVDLIAPYEQKDYLKKRSATQQFDSNGNIVVNGQHAAKKPKLLKQVPDVLQEALTPAGPMASPVASQMSNMANPTKIIKLITNRDRGRKSKAPKMAAGHSGSGSPWSSFEDQALVVLVHDMGPNWELVSDVINSTLQFKCIYRKPKECKERHKLLMDRSAAGDGADSAEDSGSSQHYQSTLPGIPKGSARQLFQRLQGPLEEDTLKAHFEKIIFLGQQLHTGRRQGDGQELKQITPAHGSHVVALSQACPNNLSGGILTPLDLCDAIPPNTDVVSFGYQGPHTNGLTTPNHHGSLGPILPNSNLSSRLPGSPGMVLGSNLPSPSGTLNAPTRDAQRYGVPRATSLQGDEQQRMQQYSQMLAGRNLQQTGVSVPGALPSGVDRGVRMLPGAHSVGMMSGVNRGVAMARPGLQRLSNPGMLNVVSSGSMLPNNAQGMQNAVNVHSGAISGPGNSMLRPRDPMQMLRPGQNLEDHRQMMMQEMQIQVPQGNSQAVHFSGINPPFSSTTASSPAQSFPVQQSQQPHQMPQQPHMFGNPHHSHIQGPNHSSAQQQAYAIRFAKERQMQQRMMSQQPHPFSGASAVSSVQNGSQIQQQTQPPPATPVPSSQPQHKQQHAAQNPSDSSAVPNHPGNTTQHKQKQRQQGQQQSRQNQQQRQQANQQAKLMKSLGRGNMLMHQNPPVEASQASGFSTASKSQVSEKNLMQQAPGYFPGSTGLIPSFPQPGNQSKIFTSPLPQSSTQMPIMPSQTDINNQGAAVQGSPSQTLLASQQPQVPSSLPLATQQQQQRHMNPSQSNNIQRMMMQQNRQMNSDGRMESSVDQVQHNQMIPTSISQCTDSGNPGVPSINQRKQEPSYDTAAVTSTSQLVSSPQETFIGNEALLPSSSQAMLQRQISGVVSMHGQGVGGQWQQQQSRQQLQSSQQQQPQHQQRSVVQGNVYAHPSESGPG